jgi:hypothetical protein
MASSRTIENKPPGAAHPACSRDGIERLGDGHFTDVRLRLLRVGDIIMPTSCIMHYLMTCETAGRDGLRFECG